MSDTTTYSVLFDKKSKYFSEDGSNPIALQAKLAYANDKLRAQGHLFLNEVHDILGLPRTRNGQTAGWVWRKFQRDSYVSFGDFANDTRFVRGLRSTVTLNFNAQADILDDVFGSDS